jgi:hypothetical protein
MKSHFFDIDVILSTNSQVWIVDKTIPNIPIMKISKSDFNLIISFSLAATLVFKL